MNIPSTYELVRTEDLEGVHSAGYLLRHKKSGAHIALIQNEDDNKVFYIGFRTPPTDSTGVAHIIEHTVLCGSEKYPLKDPFVELVKGSLNTFLNAMTYPDKTVYPVASTNDKDFQNLMDVYLDAVFHPNIYAIPEIFQQEGWHYEMDDVDGELTYNGVVYNEMKGAFSSPDSVLSRQVLNSLFPDNTYGFESGGDPKVIPELTRENYLAFHQRYYHPSNSYIYLYGDMDFAERLEYLDREYLSKYDAIDPASDIVKQNAFAEMKTVNTEFSISEEQDPAEESYLSLNYAVGSVLDSELVASFECLDYALLSKPGAPLQKVLLEKGIGRDISGGYDSGTLQPVFSITAKGVSLDKAGEFQQTIREVLEDQVKNGVDKDAIEASLNNTEFRFREADFGGYPKGLIYGLGLLDTWLYDADRPFDTLYSIEVISQLREKISTSWFEDLIQKYLLDNTHATLVQMEAVPGLTVKEDNELREKLASIRDNMSVEERQAIVEETKKLKEYQSEPTPDEDLAKIPLLERSDLRREIRPFTGTLRDAGFAQILHSDVETNGVIYLNLVFRNVRISVTEMPMLGFLLHTLGLVDTDKYDYITLADQVNSRVGGMNISPTAMHHKDYSVELTVQARTKMLPGREKDAVDLLNQVIFHSNLKDKKRIREILLQEISSQQAYFQSSGHSAASLRAQSYFSDYAAINEALNGVAYYDYLKAFEKDFDNYAEELRRKGRELMLMIFRPENMLVSVTGREEAYQETVAELPIIMATLAAGDQILAEEAMEELGGEDMDPLELAKKLNTVRPATKSPAQELYGGRIPNEGFKTPAQIQYVCRAGDMRKAGLEEYPGTFNILRVILGYDYFWNQIRVLGGAYGCMSRFKQSGEMSFVTYRDPNLEQSIETFNKTPEYLRNFNPDERTMTKFIIGTLSNVDTPLTPAQMGLRDLGQYISEQSVEDLQKRRNQILDASAEDIRALAPVIEKTLEQGVLVVIGNEGRIEDAKELFGETRNLL